MAQARGLLSVYQSRGTLVPRTCARAVVAPSGKACQGNAKNLHGPFLGQIRPSIEDKKTRPRQEELAGPRRQGPGKRGLPGQGGKTPARGSCRDDQAEAPRPRREELAGKAKPRHPERSSPRCPARPGKA